MLDFLFATTAYAQAEGASPKGPSLFELLAMPIGFLLIMYFFIIRPQQKKAKEHAELVSGLKAGDEVVTTGGIIGKVKSVAEQFVTLEVGGNTTLKVMKNNVTSRTKDPQQQAQQASRQPAKS